MRMEKHMKLLLCPEMLLGCMQYLLAFKRNQTNGFLFDILSVIFSGIDLALYLACILAFFWHLFWHFIWPSIWHFLGICSGIHIPIYLACNVFSFWHPFWHLFWHSSGILQAFFRHSCWHSGMDSGPRATRILSLQTKTTMWPSRRSRNCTFVLI